MSFDVENASLVAGGEVVPLKPIELEDIQVTIPTSTTISQAAGAGATNLAAAHTGGRIRVFGVVKDFQAAEAAIVSENNYLTLGQAVWFALVIVQHRNAGAVSAVWVPGTAALFAEVVKPTFAQIQAALDLNEHSASFAIAGDIRFHRSADEVIDVATSSLRRPAYTDDSLKSGYIADKADTSTLSASAAGYVDLPVDLTTLSGVTPGDLAVDGASLPDFAYGGAVTKVEYIAAVAPAGVGADITVAIQLDGTLVTSSELNLTLANAAVGAAPPTADTFTTNDFTSEGLDLEVDAVGTAFTAGSGTLRVFISEYSP